MLQSYLAGDLGPVAVGDTVQWFGSIPNAEFRIVAILPGPEYDAFPDDLTKSSLLGAPYILITQSDGRHAGGVIDRALAGRLGLVANWAIRGGFLKPPNWKILRTGLVNDDNFPVDV